MIGLRALLKNIIQKFYQLANLNIVNSTNKEKFKKYYNINATHIYNPIDKLKIIKLSKKIVSKFLKEKFAEINNGCKVI